MGPGWVLVAVPLTRPQSSKLGIVGPAALRLLGVSPIGAHVPFEMENLGRPAAMGKTGRHAATLFKS